jgi:hypothetical protein
VLLLLLQETKVRSNLYSAVLDGPTGSELDFNGCVTVALL